MYWLDTAILILLGVGAALGVWTGLLKQVVRVVGFAVSLIAAVFFHGWAANWLQQTCLQGSDPSVADALSYGLVFLVVLLAFQLTALVLDRCLKAVKLKWADRMLGAGLGAVKAALIMGAVFLAIIEYPSATTKEVVRQSSLAPLLAVCVDLGLRAVPSAYTNGLRSGLDRLKQEADKKTQELRDKELPAIPSSPLP